MDLYQPVIISYQKLSIGAVLMLCILWVVLCILWVVLCGQYTTSPHQCWTKCTSICFMHIVQIGTICGLSCTSLRSKLCAANLWIVCVLSQAILHCRCDHVYVDWTNDGHHEAFDSGPKKLSFHKEVWEWCAKKEPGKGTKFSFVLSHSAMGVLCTCTISKTQYYF